jgi:arylsulfatase A
MVEPSAGKKISRNTKRIYIMAVLQTLCVGSLWAEAGKPPNIIFINTDDWGIGKVPCYALDEASARIIKTPNIDELRKNGMLFTHAYAGSAICGASRCSLLTGKHSGHAAWRANNSEPPVKEWPPKAPMLGEVARQAGYTTAAFGKLSPGGRSTPEIITGTGWDYWLGYLGHVDCRKFYQGTIWENGVEIAIPENTRELIKNNAPVFGDKGIFIEDLYADKAIEFITVNKDKPFFIYYASTVPHGMGKNSPGHGLWTPSLEGYDKRNPELTQLEQLYAALMTRHDRNVGRLVETLRNLGIEKNTIVIWTSDNGDEGSYYLDTGTYDGNGPYRMEKRSLYEGGIRVPFIVSWPGTISRGSSTDQWVTHYDIMPTVADAGGDPVTDEMDGISVFPFLSGHKEKQTKRDYLYWEFYQNGKQQAVHLGKWKGYRLNGTKTDMELYDLSTDCGETKNVAAQYPEIIERMSKIMMDEHEQHPKWILPGIDTISK